MSPLIHTQKGRNEVRIRIRRIHFPRLARVPDIFSHLISTVGLRRTSKIPLSLARMILCLSLLIVPLLYSSSISYSGEFPKYVSLLAISLSLGFLFLLSAMTSRVHHFVQSTLLSLTVLFSLGYIVSAIFSLHPVASILGNRGTWALGTVGIVAATTIAVVSSNIFKQSAHAYRFLVYLSLSGLFISLMFLLSTYILPLLGIKNEGSSFLPIPESEQLSAFLTITSAATTALMLDPQVRRIRLVAFIILIVQIATIAISGIFLSIIFVSVSLPLLSLMTFSSSTLRRKQAAAAFAGVSIVLAIGVGLLSIQEFRSGTPSLPLHGSFLSDVREQSISLNTALSIFSRRPLTGTGPELLISEVLRTSQEMSAQFLSGGMVSYRFSNTFLTVLSTTGVAGTLPLLLIAVYLFFAPLRYSSLTYEHKYSLLLSLVFITSLFVHSLSALTLLAGFTSLGVCAAHLPSAAEIKQIPSSPKWYSYAIITASIIFLGYGIYAFNKAEYLFMRSTTEASPKNLTSVTDALSYNPYESAYYRAKAGYLIQYLRSTEHARNATEVERQIRQTVGMALVLNPYHFLNLQSASLAYADLAEILDVQSYTINSLSYISEAINLSPYDRNLYLQRGITFLELENSMSALDDFDTAVSLNPTDWQIYLFIAQTMQQKGWYEESRAYLETVISKSDDESTVNSAQLLLDYIPAT